MNKRVLLVAAFILLAGAAVLFPFSRDRGRQRTPPEFVQSKGAQLVVGGKPFRFVGANVDLMFRRETRGQLGEMMRFAADQGITVIRVWVSGEGGPDDVQPFSKWKRDVWFRRAPDEWNEDEFVFLDQVISEAARNRLRVQLCLANWWRDTGGVTQYLRWAGIEGADDNSFPFGINNEKAMLFYSNETARRLYRQHVERVATRRNTISGVLYRDDPTIFAYELMNEAQSLTGRWNERRAWIAEMSSYLNSLDPNHLIAPGDWGYRSAAERREWLLDHALPNIDYCDVHNYPRDDTDSFVDSPAALREFIDNRAAAALTINKPLVIGEFGMMAAGFNGVPRSEWLRAFFENAARDGVAGAVFWILTSRIDRDYGVTFVSSRDEAEFAEIKRGASLFASSGNTSLPPSLQNTKQHLIPRQFVFSQADDDPSLQPRAKFKPGLALYQYEPTMVIRGRFEKLGGGQGYVWGSGAGYFEYIVPGRKDRRRVGKIIVRAHLQPVWPPDARPGEIRTRVTLFANGTNCGSRLIPVEDSKSPLTQEWLIDSWGPRLRAARGLPLAIRFEVTPDSDWIYGLNISGWPVGYEAHDRTPVEVEIN